MSRQLQIQKHIQRGCENASRIAVQPLKQTTRGSTGKRKKKEIKKQTASLQKKVSQVIEELSDSDEEGRDLVGETVSSDEDDDDLLDDGPALVQKIMKDLENKETAGNSGKMVKPDGRSESLLS